MVATQKGKVEALKALAERRKKYESSDWQKKTLDAPAGAPMWFGCKACNAPITVSENYLTRPYLCSECDALKELNWLE